MPNSNGSSTAACDRVDQLVRGEAAAVFGRHHLVRLRRPRTGRACGVMPLADDPPSSSRLRVRRGLPAYALDAPRRRRRRRRPRRECPSLWRASAASGVALEHELERGFRADQARQALRAAGAGQQAELDLGQAELRLWRRDAIVARQRELEAAAQRVAVDRRDVRFCCRRRAQRSRRGSVLVSGVGSVLKSLTSAPPLKMPFAPVNTTAFTRRVGSRPPRPPRAARPKTRTRAR